MLKNCLKSPTIQSHQQLTVTEHSLKLLDNNSIYIENALCMTHRADHIKGPFRDPQPHPPHFSQRKLRFLHQQKPLGT